MKIIIILFTLIFSLELIAAESKPYTVYLKSGAVLTSLADNSDSAIGKGIYAQVLEENPVRRDVFYVYNRDGIPKYKVAASDIMEISKDTDLLPKMDAEKVYPPKSVFKAEDKVAHFDSQFNLHFDTLGLTALNNIYNDEIASVIATRYEARTLYRTDLPIEFGFNCNFQSALWRNDLEDIKLSIFSLGPQLKYNFFETDSLNLHALFSAEASPLYRGVTAQYEDNYSATIFDVGIESEWQSPLGIIGLGGHFRHHDVTLLNSTRENLELVPTEFTLNSIGVTVGYKIEWDL